MKKIIAAVTLVSAIVLSGAAVAHAVSAPQDAYQGCWPNICH